MSKVDENLSGLETYDSANKNDTTQSSKAKWEVAKSRSMSDAQVCRNIDEDSIDLIGRMKSNRVKSEEIGPHQERQQQSGKLEGKVIPEIFNIHSLLESSESQVIAPQENSIDLVGDISNSVPEKQKETIKQQNSSSAIDDMLNYKVGSSSSAVASYLVGSQLENENDGTDYDTTNSIEDSDEEPELLLSSSQSMQLRLKSRSSTILLADHTEETSFYLNTSMIDDDDQICTNEEPYNQMALYSQPSVLEESSHILLEPKISTPKEPIKSASAQKEHIMEPITLHTTKKESKNMKRHSSLLALCSKTNKGRISYRVGLSKRVKVDSLHDYLKR